MATGQNSVVKLTAQGVALTARLKEEREKNIKMHDGEYCKEPWYKAYLSPVKNNSLTEEETEEKTE